MQVRDERGYLIVAVNDGKTDYVECARACARSIKLHTPTAKIAIMGAANIVNEPDAIFDYKLATPFPVDTNNGYSADWQVAHVTPFRQTLKIEADMIIPHSIEHWWTMLEKRDVVLTLGARDFYGRKTNCRHYRKIFDANNLPDVYNAITYWRHSRTAVDFFDLVRVLFENWSDVQSRIKMGHSDVGTTDLIYAIAAKMMGVENVTLPNTSYPTLTHMKGKINNLILEDWTKELTWEFDKANIRINSIDQRYPFHYVVKEFSRELNEYYKQFF